jgi:murein DD-endopeptidase MepM/ murein hydrolase activator NlpD
MGLLVVCLPLKNLSVTSGFGYCVHPVTGEYAFHEGVDLRARHDTVFAIMDGLVTAAEYQSVIGLHLCIEHGQIQSVYGHLSRLFVAEKDLVFAGQPIGITGATGRVTGEHLHFAIRCGQRFIDPLQFLYELLIKKEHEQEF